MDPLRPNSNPQAPFSIPTMFVNAAPRPLTSIALDRDLHPTWGMPNEWNGANALHSSVPVSRSYENASERAGMTYPSKASTGSGRSAKITGQNGG